MLRINDFLIDTCSCWLSTAEGTIWAFVGPMLLIILVSLKLCITIMVYLFLFYLNDVDRGEKTTDTNKNFYM